MSEQDPVHWHEQLQAWIVTRYDDCVAVLSDSDTFTTDFRKVGEPTPDELLSLQTIDPPEQLPLRRVAQRAMRVKDLAELEAAISAKASELWREVTATGSFDFVTEFADPLCLGTMADLLDVDGPPIDSRFKSLNDELDRSMDSGVDPDGWSAGLRARAAFNELVETWLAEAKPGTVLGYLVDHAGETGVTHAMIVNSVRAFFHAGFEVPSRFLGNAAVACIEHESGAGPLGPGLVDTAVEEYLRFCGPVQALSRACIQPAVVGATGIAPGQTVVALIAAANRDPRQFAEPDRLHLDRSPNPHLSFGRGPHSCMGLQIARLQARAVLRLLHEAGRSIRFAAVPEIRPNATLRGYRHILIEC